MGDPLVHEVIDFWREAGPSCWFGGGEAFDARCRERFEGAHLRAARREFDHWNVDARGALALQLLLDQIPRNIYRESGHAFATDGLALHYARAALEARLDTQVEEGLRLFLYLPFEHSELLGDQELAVALIEPLGNAQYTHYAHAHLGVIRRFGRFPHRNAALGRTTTAEEQAYLDAGGGF